MDILTTETARNYVARMMAIHAPAASTIESAVMSDCDGFPVCIVSGEYLSGGEYSPFEWAVWIESNGEIYGEW
jgi:hypothetical protein